MRGGLQGDSEDRAFTTKCTKAHKRMRRQFVRIGMSADQAAEDGMAEAAAVGAFDELQLAATFGLKPDAVLHLLSGEPVAGHVWLRKIHERALGRDQRLDFLEDLLAKIRRESSGHTFDVVEVLAAIFADDDRGEVSAAGDVSANQELTFAVEAVLLPGIGNAAGNVDRICAFGDDAFETERLDLLNQRRKSGAEDRVQAQGIGEMRCHLLEHLLTRGERKVHRVAPVVVKKVEHIEHDRLFAGAAILQLLKTGAALIIERDNFAVEDKVPAL